MTPDDWIRLLKDSTSPVTLLILGLFLGWVGGRFAERTRRFRIYNSLIAVSLTYLGLMRLHLFSLRNVVTIYEATKSTVSAEENRKNQYEEFALATEKLRSEFNALISEVAAIDPVFAVELNQNSLNAKYNCLLFAKDDVAQYNKYYHKQTAIIQFSADYLDAAILKTARRVSFITFLRVWRAVRVLRKSNGRYAKVVAEVKELDKKIFPGVK